MTDDINWSGGTAADKDERSAGRTGEGSDR